jgi:hypothetical protein
VGQPPPGKPEMPDSHNEEDAVGHRAHRRCIDFVSPGVNPSASP